jgi:uncharacterized surface protein with fasciclin (FAS1) repeats
MKAYKPFFLSFLWTLFALAACVPTEPAAQDTVPINVTRVQPTTPDPAGPTIIELLAADGRFTIFLSLLEKAGLNSILAGEGPLTLFAPGDSAFATFPQPLMDILLTEPESLDNFLRQHIVIEHVSADMFYEAGVFPDVEHTAPTLAYPVKYGLTNDGQLAAGNTILLETDITASNGIIHVIDTPMLHIYSRVFRTIVIR